MHIYCCLNLLLKNIIYCNLCSSASIVNGIDGETTNGSMNGQCAETRVDNIVIGQGNGQLCQYNPMAIYSSLGKYLSLNKRYFNLIKIDNLGKVESRDELIPTLEHIDYLIEYYDPIQPSSLKFNELVYNMSPKVKEEEEEQDSDNPMSWDDTYVCNLRCVLVCRCYCSHFLFVV